MTNFSNSASAIIGPPVMSGIFYYFTHDEAPFEFAGAPFVLGGVLMLVSLMVLMMQNLIFTTFHFN
jgi:DHA1 family tetracycline resistance protein-like MFS transporter